MIGHLLLHSSLMKSLKEGAGRKSYRKRNTEGGVHEINHDKQKDSYKQC